MIYILIISIDESIKFSDEKDSLIWKYESNRICYVSSFYSIINFRGVVPVNVPAVWKIAVPPKIHIFLWLMLKNKLLTRDNLSKR